MVYFFPTHLETYIVSNILLKNIIEWFCVSGHVENRYNIVKRNTLIKIVYMFLLYVIT